MAKSTRSFALWLHCAVHNSAMQNGYGARTMSESLYAKYIRERENKQIIEWEDGFITYRKLSNEVYYLIDCFVDSENRQRGIARKLVGAACDVAKADGARQVLGSVCTDAQGVTTSLAAILAGGFRFSSQQGNMLYFIKDL